MKHKVISICMEFYLCISMLTCIHAFVIFNTFSFHILELGQSSVVNVAEGSNGSVSSVYVEWDGVIPVDNGIHLAVDGSRRTCMQTNRDDYPSIGLDLGKEYQVSYIEIYLNGKLLLRFRTFSISENQY